LGNVYNKQGSEVHSMVMFKFIWPRLMQHHKT